MRSLIRAALAALVFCCVHRSRAGNPARAAQLAGLGAERRGVPPLPVPRVRQPATRPTHRRRRFPLRLARAPHAGGGRARRQLHAALAGVCRDLAGPARQPRALAAGRARSMARPAPVVARDGVPSLRLAPGNYTVAGRFKWSTRPESLPLPHLTALVDLTVDNQRVVQPERPGGAVWLGKRRSAEQAAAMEVQVYRLVRDEVPAYLLTRIRLNVAGDAREELLARVLPDGFTPLSLDGDVPARLERDGRLRVQVRAGSPRHHAGGARDRRRQHAGASRSGRPVGARGDLELRGQGRVARRGGRRRRGHRSRPGQRAARVAGLPGVPHGARIRNSPWSNAAAAWATRTTTG